MARSPYVIEYRGGFDLDAPPEVVWSTIEHSERFGTWWSWLHDFRLEGAGLVDGAVLHGVVVPPLPYRMRLHVLLDRCVPPRRIEATVWGDLQGSALLELFGRARSTRAEVEWTIEMMQIPMRIAARLSRPLLTWGHDRVVEMTVSSFRRHLARNAARPLP